MGFLLDVVIAIVGFILFFAALTIFGRLEEETSLYDDWKAERKEAAMQKRIGYFRTDPRSTYQIEIDILISWEKRFKDACGDAYIAAATSLFPELKPYLAEVVPPVVDGYKGYEDVVTRREKLAANLVSDEDRVKVSGKDLSEYIPFDQLLPAQPCRDYVVKLSDMDDNLSFGPIRVRYPSLTKMLASSAQVYTAGHALVSLHAAYGEEKLNVLERFAANRMLTDTELIDLLKHADQLVSRYDLGVERNPAEQKLVSAEFEVR